MRNVCSVVFICCALAACALQAGWADPNATELRSFVCLVPDYSKTSGGCSPVLSPDGRTLAFYASGGLVSIRHWAESCASAVTDVGNPQDSWTLEFQSLGNTSWYDNDTRNMDWSPDGKRLVFVDRDACLYVAEGFDYQARTATVTRLLPQASPGNERDEWYVAPRWSPDGRSIALIWQRHQTGRRTRGPYKVCVLDVASRVIRTLAEDGYEFARGFDQPWSPDGQFLVYNSIFNEPKTHSPRYDITVVSVDGERRTRITTSGTSMYPSWSPNSDRIALGAEQDYWLTTIGGIGYYEIHSVNGSGGDERVVSRQDIPSGKDVEAIEAKFGKGLRKRFKKEFRSVLTPEQLKRLSEGKMGLSEMMGIAELTAAREIGGEFAVTYVREMEKGLPADQLSRLESTLPRDQRQKLWARKMGFLLATVRPKSFGRLAGTDGCPVWSPDSKSIAFVRLRQRGSDFEEELYTQDLASGRQRLVLSSRSISCVSWTADGKSLLAQARGLLGLRAGKGGEVDRALGYPEIWLLTLK